MVGMGTIVDPSDSLHPNQASSRQNKAVFLDRDGTLIQHREYLTEITDLQLFDQTWEAVRLLNQNQIPAIVVTNQSAVARGLLSEPGLTAIHSEIQARLQRRGASLDGFYYCPHHPTTGNDPYRTTCSCRKPQPGLILQAANELGLDPLLSFMVGDSGIDIESGRRAGCRTVLIADPDGGQEISHPGSNTLHPDFEATDILHAVQWIIGEMVRSYL